MNTARKINWPTTLFLVLTPIIGFIGTAWWAMTGQFHWQTLLLFGLGWMATGMSITGGYHRLFSHRAYEASPLVRLLYIIVGSAAWEGSVAEWGQDHRRHHRYVDTGKDPYNINEGFFWAHCKWMFYIDGNRLNPQEIPDLWKDPVIRAQHRHYVWWAIASGFLLPLALCMLWGDFWGGLLVAGTLRTVANHHSTFFINSLCHMIGKQTYSDTHTARDNWLLAIPTWGEGYHNFHHEFGSDYRNAIRYHQWDPTKWLIYTLYRLGLASNLRRTETEKIVAARLRMEEKRLARQLTNLAPVQISAVERVMEAARERIHHASERLADLRQEYRELAREKTQHTREQLAELSHRMQEAEQELLVRLAEWQRTRQGALRMATA